MPHNAHPEKNLNDLFALHRQSACVSLGQVTEAGYLTPGYQTLPDLWKPWSGDRNPHIPHKRVQGGLKKEQSIEIFPNLWQLEPLPLGFPDHVLVSPH